MLLRSRHRFQQGNETTKSRPKTHVVTLTMNRQTILSHNMKRGVVTKIQWLTKEMVSRHAFVVATQNAVESKTARSRHGIEVTTQNLLRGQTNVVTTKINIAGNKNDVAT